MRCNNSVSCLKISALRFILQKRNARRFINSGGRQIKREFPVDTHDSERDETLSKKYVPASSQDADVRAKPSFLSGETK
jgi:hypothetical protein